jgi:hypothetical protein
MVKGANIFDGLFTNANNFFSIIGHFNLPTIWFMGSIKPRLLKLGYGFRYH